MKEWNCEQWWGLKKRENGHVEDWGGIYGKKYAVYGRMVDDMVVSV